MRQSQEFCVISDILDHNSIISEIALQYISEGKKTEGGMPGMSGEEVVRCSILKRIHGLSYSQLSFHISDSIGFREFVRLGIEGCISILKRVFRLNRCTWRGIKSFKSYVWSGVVAHNPVVLARHLIN